MTPIRLFCSDLDGTLLGNPEATRRFKSAWEGLAKSSRPMLSYASGRLVQDVIDLLATQVLPWPDYLIGGVGTQIYDGRRKRPLSAFNEQFRAGWDLKRIEAIIGRFPGVTRQPPQFLHPYKSSWYLHRAAPEAIAALERQLAEAGLQVCVVYSSARDLDVLPGNTNKGGALKWLCEHLKVPLENVLVAGDTGNDSSLFLLPGVRGIVVENAQPELIEAVVKLPTFNATQVMADGALEGLQHFGVIPAAPHPEVSTLGAQEMDPTLRMLFTEAALGSLTSEERDLIATGYRHALIALRKNITPLGFSACSLSDNEVTGTDANYRSVWARDGAITVVGTIESGEPDIRAAQKATLRTLFDHLAPNGQIPANVRLADASPDFSGVGGICSIDSGLWAIVAFHQYVRKTGDLDLLSEYAHRLQRLTEWLCALDSNNDLLLEIPEAGDWTDLFGRSYHVLYDEVLWYRANVAYGRLLEMQRKFEAASECLRRSQAIRAKILEAFWPSTKPRAGTERFSFAQQQASVGDSSYLLAEITPFSFNWRCDVLGNVQAFISNVLDADRARTAFKFMWGVGVNEPYPVVNLYPPVQSGDPDWRPYYTVNLLNLPGHYHNGGIWPFIGGMWVRFIHRLGLYEVACRELLKLAQLNRLGKNQEWEFNEWVHSRTGRPMGKSFQAWSASSYLHACQELQINPEQLTHD
ncbi:MAG: HAD-IIB family hydrolase [Verrucomicrobia bacterium]|nr:HAD-IIB family hydrolase [Verrucomicrobiota bacterium]